MKPVIRGHCCDSWLAQEPSCALPELLQQRRLLHAVVPGIARFVAVAEEPGNDPHTLVRLEQGKDSLDVELHDALYSLLTVCYFDWVVWVIKVLRFWRFNQNLWHLDSSSKIFVESISILVKPLYPNHFGNLIKVVKV